MNLGVMLADCALRYADKEAVICGDRRITFGELCDRAWRLGNALKAHGMETGDRAALYLPNSAELTEAMAALGCAGGVMVPFSTRLTTDEVTYIFEDCDPRFVFYAPEFRDAAHQASANLKNATLVAMKDPAPGELSFEDLIANGDPSRPPPLPDGFEDCVIGYTSGTTGRPKGAVSTHRNIVLVHGYMNSVEWGLSGSDRTLVTAPMAHRTGLGRVANMLCLGSAIVIMPRFDAVEAVDLCQREKINIVGAVPTIMRMMMPEIEKRPAACASVEKIVATGEVFPAPLKERLFTVLPDVQLFSFYAQTESGFIANLRPEEQLSHAESIGRAVPGVEIRIVDADRNPVPPGEAGNVLVRCGPPGQIMTMKEYFNLPEATADTIVDGGWIDTGDVCRIDEDGYLYFVDRSKDMIVSGGLNIYSKEVELALIRHPEVADAAVIGVPDPEFGESVLAYIEPEGAAAPDADDLIEHCKSVIASYKKPKHVRFVDALPRTGTGKVQKQVLRAKAADEFEPVD